MELRLRILNRLFLVLPLFPLFLIMGVKPLFPVRKSAGHFQLFVQVIHRGHGLPG